MNGTHLAHLQNRQSQSPADNNITSCVPAFSRLKATTSPRTGNETSVGLCKAALLPWRKSFHSEAILCPMYAHYLR